SLAYPRLSPTPPHASTSFLFFTRPPPSATYTLSLHDALPIFVVRADATNGSAVQTHTAALLLSASSEPLDLGPSGADLASASPRSEEHTSELQSRGQLVCRLLLEKKKTHAGRNDMVGHRATEI